MKQIIITTIVCVTALVGLIIWSDHSKAVVPFELQQDADPTHCLVDGDEMPGIGGSIDKPDTALVYFNTSDRRTHIKYLHVLPDSILNHK